MEQGAYTLFETPLGVFGIGWREPGDSGAMPRISYLQLPESTPAATERRIARCAGASRSSSPPRPIVGIIERIRRHLAGHLQDFRSVALDLARAGTFERRVYTAARAIPAGQTRTYGEIAQALGKPGAARAVGQALGRNPIPLIIPCHRVLAAGGKPGGFSGPGGLATKLRLLEIERAPIARVAGTLSFDFDTM